MVCVFHSTIYHFVMFHLNSYLALHKLSYHISQPLNIDVTTEDPGSDGWSGVVAAVDGTDRHGYSWAYVNSWGGTASEVAHISLGKGGLRIVTTQQSLSFSYLLPHAPFCRR